MSDTIPIIIEETAGIDRTNEPVTVGIPFPKGFLKNTSELSLIDPNHGNLPLQTDPLAVWPDGSAKWVLLDFQVTADANTTKELKLNRHPSSMTDKDSTMISIKHDSNSININTNTASFFINTGVFKPFNRVVVGDNDILNSTESKVILTDQSGIEYEPHINNIFIETEGKLRTTLKAEGEFRSSKKTFLANFFSRVSFFANSTIVKIDFTIHNPQAAKHPGGLWDLGDPGSIFFDDLSIYTTLNSSEPSTISYQLNDEPSVNGHELNCENNLIIYQDSSGGENWKSLNHVNRNGDVRNTFRGYRVSSDEEVIKEGFRANPIVSINDKNIQISGAVQNFWQNFPKALETNENTLIVRLFPKQYNDLFELQGGEQKTHTFFLSFDSALKGEMIHNPLIPRATPEWHSKTKAINHLIPEKDDPNKEYIDLANTAITGKNNFLARREIIDEYGWRNFGEFYADHEAVGHKGSEPLVSHYNNQYDGIYGTLMQYISSGNTKWFQLADQLCSHVKDIDIYHTDGDRPEYNRGYFWHTDHYIDAHTSTHRCFSKGHLDYRDKSTYGGGPSLSHNYTTGLLLHHYLTGNRSSLETIQGLNSSVENTMDSENSLLNYSINSFRKIKCFIEKIMHGQSLVLLGKVYGLNGPGRASGNSLNSLMDLYILTDSQKILNKAEGLIKCCISPNDSIENRELLDTENRWFYTIFLQSLGKYLDVKTECGQFDSMWYYARQSLINYAEWMVINEYPYLERPDKLEHPNETWATQEIRKCNALLYAAKYSDSIKRDTFLEKASFFYNEGVNGLLRFETKALTRPLVLMMQNGMMYKYFKTHKIENIKIPELVINFQVNKYYKCYCISEFISAIKILTKFSLKREIQFLKWRLFGK